MDAKIGRFFESVGSFFSGGDGIPWCDRDIIAGCEREVAEGESVGNTNESLMRLSWALAHSRQPEDVNRGIAMLEDTLDSSSSPLQMREKIYLLAVGYYRRGNYSKSQQFLERCLEEGEDVSLEWLFSFVEECLSGTTSNPYKPLSTPSTTTTTTAASTTTTNPHLQSSPFSEAPQPQSPDSRYTEDPVAVSVKARTKRRRTTTTKRTQPHVHPNHTLHWTPSEPPLLHQTYWLADSEQLIIPQKEKPAATVGLVGGEEREGQQQGRSCSRCLSQRTPQWRSGPLGPKTLCNACGVRWFKSGRLLPEYRLAKSPSLVSYKHSNSHKKKKPATGLVGGKEREEQQQGRRCSHCPSQRTPQWRAGLLGPKTLCNVCEVKFKSGRLLPEYRPTKTKSPTFVSYKHSKSHKVMQISALLAAQPPNPDSRYKEGPVAVSAKARTKRRRTTTTPRTQPHVHPNHTLHWSPSDPPLLHQTHWLADSELLIIPQKEKPAAATAATTAELVGGEEREGRQQQGRSCSHCLSQRTPQWREGPLGPKTLCNACGVRFKSGRLFPEYRPANSPSFVSYKHSNSHKEVMQMRSALLSSHPN